MTYRRRVRSRTRVMQAFAFLVVLVAGGISTAPASAHFDSRPYIFGDKNCRNPTSPINFGFYGDRATARNTSGHTGRHTGWGKTILDSTKYFSDHGRCAPLHWARASGNSLASTRVHIRASPPLPPRLSRSLGDGGPSAPRRPYIGRRLRVLRSTRHQEEQSEWQRWRLQHRSGTAGKTLPLRVGHPYECRRLFLCLPPLGASKAPAVLGEHGSDKAVRRWRRPQRWLG